MAGNIKGITIEFQGDTSKLDKSLRSIDKSTSKIDKELKQVNKDLKFNPKNVELWKQKQTLLTQKIVETEKKLETLKKKQSQMDAAGVDKNSEEYRKLQREIIETESKLKTFKSQLKAIGNVKLRALGEQFKEIGKKMQNVGKSMTQYVTVPIAAGMGAAVKTTMDFDSAMSQVAATMGKTTEQMLDEKVATDEFEGSLRDLAIEMGSKTAFSATQAAEALNYMALAGYDAKTSAEMLPKVLNLAAAGNMDLATASDMVTDSQSALGLSIKQTDVLIDQMARTSSKSNTSVEQLGQAILTVGGTAKSMKGGTEELNAVLGVLADNGIKGAEGGTALRNILLSLGSPTSKARGTLEELGVSLYDVEGNMRDLRDVMPELAAALDGLTDEQRTQAITAIFNKRDLKSVNALLATNTDRWNELSDSIQNSGGAAEQMAATQLDNLKGSLTILKSAIEGLAIRIGDVLTPYIKKLAEFITGLVDKFNQLSPTTQKIITIVGLIVAAIGPLLLIVGTVIAKIGLLLTVLPAITAAFAAFAAPIGIVVAAIAALVAIGVLLYKNWDTIKAKGIAAWNAITNAVNIIVNKIKKNFTTLKTFLANTWNGIKTTVTTAWNKIKNAITNPITTAYNTVKTIINKIKRLFPLSIGKLMKNIKLPHFSLDWGSKDFGKLGSIKYPKGFNVKWYAQGGIFDSPTLAGIGEAGPEAVVPLDTLWKKLDAIAEANGAVQPVVINVYGSDNMSVNELAAAVEKRIIQMQKRRAEAWA